MSTSESFDLSFDFLKFQFAASKMSIISIIKRIVDTAVISDVTCTRQSV